jgi:hypothetical protein
VSTPEPFIVAPPSGAASQAWLNLRTGTVDESYVTYGRYVAGAIDVGRVEPFLAALSTAPFPVVPALRKLMLDEVITERRDLATNFARRAASRGDVREVWLNTVEPEFVVSVITDDLDLERDLELRALFIDLLRLTGDVSFGDLEIHPQSEGVPEEARIGTKLA